MIIDFKIFEKNLTPKKRRSNNKLKVGDYVIIDSGEFIDDNLKAQLNDEIGIVKQIRGDVEFPIEVEYPQHEVLAGYGSNRLNVDYIEILNFSKNRKDLEIIIDTKKYNL